MHVKHTTPHHNAYQKPNNQAGGASPPGNVLSRPPSLGAPARQSLSCPFTGVSLEQLGLRVDHLNVPAGDLGSPQYMRDHLAEPGCTAIDLAIALRRTRGASVSDHVVLLAVDESLWEPVVGLSALESASPTTRLTIVRGDRGMAVVAGLFQAMLAEPMEADPILAEAARVEIVNAHAKLYREFDIDPTAQARHLSALVQLGPAWVADAPMTGRSQPTISRRLAGAGSAQEMIEAAKALQEGRLVRRPSFHDRVQAAIRNLPNPAVRAAGIDVERALEELEHASSTSDDIGWLCNGCGALRGRRARLPPALRNAPGARHEVVA